MIAATAASLVVNTPQPNSADEEVGEFAAFDDIGGVIAYVFHQHGEAGVREVLDQLKDGWKTYPGSGPKEQMDDIAGELYRRGLDTPAEIVSQMAEQMPSGIDVVPDYYRTSYGDRAEEIWRQKWIQAHYRWSRIAKPLTRLGKHALEKVP